MKKRLYIFCFFGLLLFPFFSHGFTFTVTPTTETCTGNGSLAFNSINTDPNGTIVYLVYKLPDLSIPIASISALTLGGLSSGDYRIIAKETVGNVSTTQQQDVTINSAITPLIYSVQSLNQACSATSNISVLVASGVAVSYEIFSGPLLFPIQSSNTFSGLPVGIYKIRVFDTCGNGIVQTFTVTLNTTGLSISPPIFSNTTPVSCNSSIITHTLTPATGTIIGYPLSIQYSLNLPGSSTPTIINSTLNNGDSLSQDIAQTIPVFNNQSYPYSVSITDVCGTTFLNNFIADQSITLTAFITPTTCDQDYFTLLTSNFSPPFTLNFTNAPMGFTPSSYNANYPGPFNQTSIDFGDLNNPTPHGQYDISITDACGRTTSTTLDIISKPPTPDYVATNDGCLKNTETVVITIPNYHIANAFITSAPISYPFSTPHDVSSFVNSTGVLTMNSIPLGNYTFSFTDTCSDLLSPLVVPEPLYVDKGLVSNIRQGCSIGQGAVRLTSLNAKLTSVIIVSAPANFPFPTPYNASNNIAVSNGSFYMANLPAGNYTFNTIDACSFTFTKSLTIDGYSITKSNFSLQPNCGSFNIPLDFVSNGTQNQTFWLQKLLDPGTNTWGNPDTNAPYLDGTIPNATNSYPLSNNTINYNLTFNGSFRIIRSFITFNNGSEFNSGLVATTDKNCIEILSPLSFNQALEIKNIYRMPCSSSGSLDVIVVAIGTAPLHYKIVKKDGIPFVIDNGNSNIFLNLAPALYTFQIDDSCGDTLQRPFDVSSLLSLVNINNPGDVLQCVNTITGNTAFDLTSLNSIILGSQSPTDYTLSYYTSLLDAQSASNPIPNLANFIPTTNPQTVYVRLIFNQLPNCYQTDFFNLIVGQTPKINLNINYTDCTSNPVTLDASIGNFPTTTYLWSTGETTPQIVVSQIGTNTITVTATNTYGSANLPCTSPPKNIAVTITELPSIDHIETQDWTPNENTITVVTTNNGDFEYSLDGIHFQNENVFSNLEPGVYTVYVQDRNACSTLTQEVWLLYYPKFFTPNNDGINDTWFIPNSNLEPDFKVVIYDRYGKMITAFTSNSTGWDGNYNGNLMFADDYWFVVYREDGRIHKGHFTLKR